MMMLERFDHFGACLTLLVYRGSGFARGAHRVPGQRCTPDNGGRVKCCGRDVRDRGK